MKCGLEFLKAELEVLFFKTSDILFWLANMLVVLMIIKINFEHFFNYFQTILKFCFVQSTHIAKVLTLHLAWRPPERQMSHRHKSLLYVELELFSPPGSQHLLLSWPGLLYPLLWYILLILILAILTCLSSPQRNCDWPDFLR